MSVPPSVSSTRTTQSAPGGIGAPVMMRIAWPGASAAGERLPAAIVAATGRAPECVAVAARTSSPRTA